MQLNNVELFSASLAGKNKYPAIILGPHARDVMMCNVSAEEFIGKRWASYAISIEPGAKNIMIDNLNAGRVNKGAIEDKGAVNLKVGHVIGPEDAP